MDNLNYQRTVLSNGLRIVTEFIPHVRSIAIGFWFDTGSRDELEDFSGIAHFLEHMNFKGTPRRSVGQIAREIEGRGGILNAFTSKEVTCYHARVVDEQTARAVDLLSDITQNSIFDPDEIDRERDVILEELKTVEDTPDDLVFEHFMAQVFGEHPLGRSVLGTEKSLQAIHGTNLAEFCAWTYHGKRVVIAAAGRLNHNRLVRMIEKRMGGTPGTDHNRTSPSLPLQQYHRQDLHTATQQAHIIWGCRGLSYSDPEKYVLFILSTLLGGGMSSRLFQTIREKYGYAYSVYSFTDNYQDSGLFGIYAGTQPERVEKVLYLIRKEVHKLVAYPVSDRELQRTKDQLKGNIVLGLESPNSRMNRLAKMELVTGSWVSIDDVIERINEVTSNDIQSIAKELFEEQALFTTVLWPN